MIARHTVEETQLGNYEGKYLKIFRKTRATLMDIIDDKSVGVIEEDPRRATSIKIAKPVGVIGALSPSTNPEATPVIKAISAVKGRNSIIIAPHPRAKLTNKLICDLMRDAIVKMGAPADLVIGIDTPTVEKTNELMRQCDRILATGGARDGHRGLFDRARRRSASAPAMRSSPSTRPPTSTTPPRRSACPRRSTSPPRAAPTIACILVDAIHDTMLAKLVAKGGLVLDEEQKAKLQKAIWVDGAHQRQDRRPDARSSSPIMPASTSPRAPQFFIVPETGTGPDHPFSGEKMTVTMALYRAKDIDEAIELTNRIQAYQGQGHSCGIYSTLRRQHHEAGRGRPTPAG